MCLGGWLQSAQSGLTLEQCLDAYTREETLGEEDSWFCSGCKAHRRGVMKIDLWKMPDVLVRQKPVSSCLPALHCVSRIRIRKSSQSRSVYTSYSGRSSDG